MAVLILKEISKAFDDTMVLDGISLDLVDGELLVLLGPSGCGKSTCLRLIAGLEKLDKGEIHIGTRRVDRLRPKERKVAMVFQNYSLFPHMSVHANLSFPLKVAGMKKAEIQKRVEKTARLLDLFDKLSNRPGQLSGGQRQRVALGRAVIRQPDLFLLDEPLSNLDADLRVRMRHEIVRIQKELSCTTVYVTHDQSEALTMGDRIALLHEGKLIQVGTPEELYKNPRTLFAARFIGSPQINVIEGTVSKDVILPFGFHAPDAITNRDEKKVTLCIRPEDVEISGAGEFAGKVISCEYVGDSYQVVLAYQENRLTASQLSKAFKVGEEVRFSIDRSDILYFDAGTGELIR